MENHGERELIRRISSELRRAPRAGGVPASTVPFGDDAAGLPMADPGWIWTTDILTAGVDFESGRHSWGAVGRKALAVNLSDCAAMAAVPRAALCGLVLQESLSVEDALQIVRGMHECAIRFGCPIVGGDTNTWPHPTVISVTVAGQVPPGRKPVLRNGARPGDRIYVSGPLGGSILGRHMTFNPRVELGLEINRRLEPHAMIDISDGLSVDLRHVLEASGCAAELDCSLLERVIHEDAHRLGLQDGKPPCEHALHDGEDFELLVALGPDASAETCRELGLMPLGTFVAGAPRVWLGGAGAARQEVAPHGWEHSLRPE
jgi:thiamine-monophosphate kinase